MATDAGTAYIQVKANTSALNSSGGLFSTLGKHLGGIFAGAFAVSGLIQIGTDLVKTAVDWTKAAEDAAAANHLSFALIRKDADGVAFKFGELRKWALHYGDAINKDDEDVITLISHFVRLANLKPFGPDQQASAERFAKLTFDVAAGTKQSADSIATLILSLANDAPTRAIPRLQKMGALTLDQVLHFKELIKQGHIHEASLGILASLQAKWDGEARKGVTSSQKLSRTWQNFKEEVGAKLVPILEKVNLIFQSLLDKLIPLVRHVHNASDAWKLFLAAARYTFGMIEFYFGEMLNKMASAVTGFINFWIDAFLSAGIIPILNKLTGSSFSLNTVPTPNFTSGGPPSFQNPFGPQRSPHTGRGFIVPPPQFGGHGGRGAAEGGIVSRPTNLLVGEAGPEAIVPLSHGGMKVTITDSNLGLVMTGVLEDDKAFADRSGRAQR